MYAKERKMIKEKRKKRYAMLCCVCVCLSVCLQDHWKCLFIIIISILVIFASIQLPRVLSQLYLEVSRKQDELLMLLNCRLNFEGKVVRISI